MNRYWIETYGCQMNKAESNALEQELSEGGWIEAGSAEEADLVVLNTCSVRATAENRIWGRIGHYKTLKRKHPHTLVLMGCMAERLKDEIRRMTPAVDIVVGTFQKKSLVRLLQQTRSGIASALLDEGSEYRFSSRHGGTHGFKAFVPIMHGCDNFCSYCIVPYVRGREVSRPPEEIFAEISGLLDRGVREITLLGQNVNSYRYRGDKGKSDFPDLLRSILRRFPELPWLRFLTSHPKDFSPELIACMAEFPALCRHIHLPVQHGSNRILAAMNRKYTRETYLSLVDSIAEALPGVSLTTDILIGFPGETEEDFRLTLDLMKTVGYNDAFTYHYNPREGTKAFELPDTVPEKVKLDRLGEVIELQRVLGTEKKRSRIGKTTRVLVEEISKKNDAELLSRTEQDEMVIFPGDAASIGTFVTVRLLDLKGNTFIAEEVR